MLSDIHANSEALDACLAHALGQGATDYAFLGDLVGYGADPAAVLDTIIRYHASGAVVLRGNHDEAMSSGAAGFSAAAADAVEWTRARLDEAERRFLADLPLTARVGDALLVHASAWRPKSWPYITTAQDAARSLAATDAALTFVGHVHRQSLYYRGADGSAQVFQPTAGVAIPLATGRRWLASIGSVGQPRDGNPAAGYALLDTARRTLTFHRVAYDWSAAAEKIRRGGLSPSLADRLGVGR